VETQGHAALVQGHPGEGRQLGQRGWRGACSPVQCDGAVRRAARPVAAIVGRALRPADRRAGRVWLRQIAPAPPARGAGGADERRGASSTGMPTYPPIHLLTKRCSVRPSNFRSSFLETNRHCQNSLMRMSRSNANWKRYLSLQRTCNFLACCLRTYVLTTYSLTYNMLTHSLLNPHPSSHPPLPLPSYKVM